MSSPKPFPEGSHISIPHGTADFTGVEMMRREGILESIRGTYRQFGFDPLHTPVLENREVFNGHHGEGEKLIFHLQDGGAHPLVLRYDLTVPLARVVSMYPDLPKPYKRFQIGNVFRDDQVDKGHFREFTQCDGDVVGNNSLTADADIIMLAHAGLENLGFEQFIIRINHRGIIKALAEEAGINTPGGVLTVQRALDFADKVIKTGVDGIRQDLQTRGIPEKIIDNILRIVSLKGSHQDLLIELDRIFSENVTGMKGVQELREILSYLPPETLERVSLDFTLARGADYYTGFILEGVIPGIPVGAVLGGGRYDNLVSAFGQDNLPAVGMAFGFERIYTAMKELDMYPPSAGKAHRVLVASTNSLVRKIAFLDSQKLRAGDLSTDFIDTTETHSDEEEAKQALLSYMKERLFSGLVIFKDTGIKEIVGDPDTVQRIKSVIESQE